MFDKSQYQLIDFGRGRKLERFGPVIADRPSPAAAGMEPACPTRWTADLRFDRETSQTGRWRGVPPEAWQVCHAQQVCFHLKCTPFGHVGLFPEQQRNWNWIAEQVAASSRRLRVLNLFAYTGGSTLAAAAAGAAMVHVDSAKNVVAWARANAELAGLADASIRWIVEDALKFVRREVRRGNKYDAVILDPPSYGHGPQGNTWKIQQHLPGLLAGCRDLLVEQPLFLLLTLHSERLPGTQAEAMLAEVLGGTHWLQPMQLISADRRALDSGIAIYWRPD